MKPPGRTAATFAPSKAADLAALFQWYREPQTQPFFTEIAGPTPCFDIAGFRDYCRNNSRLWVTPDRASFLLLTYIQTSMRVANLDFNHRDPPDPGTPRARQLAIGVAALCGRAKVLEVQLLAIASDRRRIALAEALGMRHEGLLRDHFYHAGTYHDLAYYGYRSEQACA